MHAPVCMLLATFHPWCEQLVVAAAALGAKGHCYCFLAQDNQRAVAAATLLMDLLVMYLRDMTVQETFEFQLGTPEGLEDNREGGSWIVL